MDDIARARHDALRKETIIGAVMNVVLGLIFFLIVFGWHRSATASIAIDFLPQTIGMTFLGGMAASLICLAKVARGTLVPAGPVPTRRQQAIRVLACAIAATVVFGGTAALLLATLGPVDLAPEMAIAMKSLYGIGMAFVTMPPILRMALGMPFWPDRTRSVTIGARP